MLPTMTHERKCGKVYTVCSSFLYRRMRNSLSISANRIGAGKHSSNSMKLIHSVMPTERKNAGSRNRDSKFVVPFQGLARMPSLVLKLLKASVKPPMGM